MQRRSRHPASRCGAVLLAAACSATAACGGGDALPTRPSQPAAASTSAAPVPGPAAASEPAETPEPGTSGASAGPTRADRHQPPGAHGDGYTRNVTAGAACPRTGALGFTADARAVRCETTPADPQPRWRAPEPGGS